MNELLEYEIRDRNIRSSDVLIYIITKAAYSIKALTNFCNQTKV